MQFWTSREPGNDRLIAFANDIIYKGNPPVEEIDLYTSNIQTGTIPTTSITGIPLSYIKEIRLQAGKTYIEILFGRDSEEQLRIKDPVKRNEIFEFFKSNIPKLTSHTDHYSKLRAGKKPLIAIGVLLALFLWTLYFSTGIEAGYEYQLSRGASITGIVLMLANLGTKNVILLFAALIGIAVYFFLKKIKDPPIIERLTKQS